MPWGREDTREKERADQLQKDLDALKAENTALKELETSLASERTAREAQATELETVRASLTELQNSHREPPAKDPPSQNQRTSFLEDEDAAFNERAQPLMNGVVANAARLARMIVEQEIQSSPRDKFLMNKYRKEYEGMVASLSPVQQTMEQAYRNCFKLVKADHTDEMLDSASRGNDFFSESSGGAPPPVEHKDEKLTAEETSMAKKFGISEADYLKSKKQIQFIGAQ